MKRLLFRILVLGLSALVVLAQTESLAARGGGGRGGGGGGRGGGGGGGRAVARQQAGWVEWEEADAGADPAAGLRYREEAIAQGEARPGMCRDPAATARVVWLRTRMSPAETSTDPKLLPRSNLVQKAPDPPCLRLLKEIGRGPARGATKGSLTLRTKLAAANSRGELKELGAASSVRWRRGA